MSEEREAGVRKKGRHEVKRIHLGGGANGRGSDRNWGGDVEQNGAGRENPRSLCYRLGALYTEGLPAGTPRCVSLYLHSVIKLVSQHFRNQMILSKLSDFV